MTATTAARYPTLGFDPTPGDQAALADVIATLNSAARALGEICSVLHGVAAGEWRGQAADAFRASITDDLVPLMDTASEAFSGATRAVIGWGEFMATAQSQSRRLEQEAAEAAADTERLTAVVARARQHAVTYTDEGRRVAEALKHAIDAAPDKPGVFSRLIGGAGSAIGGFR